MGIRGGQESIASLHDMRILIAFFGACLFEPSTAASGQPVSAGIIGGSSLTQDFQSRGFGDPAVLLYYSPPLRWIAGGMVEVRLPKHLAVEVDGLYHDLAFTIKDSGGLLTHSTLSRGRSRCWRNTASQFSGSPLA